MKITQFVKTCRGVTSEENNVAQRDPQMRVTPAMAAGVSDRMWSLEELVEQTSK